MARFYGEVWGKAKTTATREGTEASGLEAHIRGWSIGVRVYMAVDSEGRDTVLVYLTGGSKNPAATGAPVFKATEGDHD